MKPGAHEIPRISAPLHAAFTAYARRYIARHFHAFRVLHPPPPKTHPRSPVVLFLNHASWWDPLVCLRLAREFFPERASFAPMDATMLARYRFFRHLGFFGVDRKSPVSARTFLRQTDTILSEPKNALWLTPQGRFADVRERPAELEPGLGLLAARSGHATFIPLAIEYPFWAERKPEILVTFGAPVPVHVGSSADWTDVFSRALEATQDELSAASLRRKADEWQVLAEARSGVHPVYDAWLRLRERLAGPRPPAGPLLRDVP